MSGDRIERQRPDRGVLRGDGVAATLKAFALAIDRAAVLARVQRGALAVAAGEIRAEHKHRVGRRALRSRSAHAES
jgi:hypothetical protein